MGFAGKWHVIYFDETNGTQESLLEMIEDKDYQKISDNEFSWQGNLVKTWLEMVDGKPQQVFSGMTSKGYGIIARKF
ncbi:hypothetical protein [Streptococcus gallolyticus]|uniref:hypothetical protein n=1 Tax=Streptococcus gallolyticus TaxID=315405 RepID=UPI002283B360|nr:hypothetical protein [Streptococcus gallolyticus]MCY7188515.1 hypothetical protein [Streptococcus gallolyticus subsp. gallolyticus]